MGCFDGRPLGCTDGSDVVSPAKEILLIRLLLLSATYTFDDGSTATPLGL